MPRTINEGFIDFHTKLTPTPGESEAAKGHRASIESCLKTNFNMQRFFRTGSFGNGTSISGYSDVDYFAAIPTDRLKQKSSATLSFVRSALDTRFPNTGVHVDCPAIVVPFGSSAKDATEIVPADYATLTDDGYKVYDIPDCLDSWKRASPDAHNAYVKYINDKLGGKVKPLIRFIKAWKYYMNVPISSFYLELRVAKYASGENSIVYDIDVKQVFAHLANIDLAKMQDPMGISGYISPCSTDVKLNDAKSKLDTALTRAENARAASERDDVKGAFEWWDKLFGGNFPSYYK